MVHVDEDERAAMVGRLLAALVETTDAMTSGDPLRAIHALTIRGHALELALREAVALSRLQGITWQKIADALGTSKAAAHERFSLRGSGDDVAPTL